MRMSKRHGFTLIELLVVIAIIAVLVSIAFPVFNTVQERARAAQDMSNLRQIGLATQMYMNDNDGVIFSSDATAGTWMSQLEPKYVPAWKIFESPFDKRTPSELGDATTPISYGLNGNTKGGSSIAGLLSDKIANPSAFILFAPAQRRGTTVSFQGSPAGFVSGVLVYKNTSNSQSVSGGTHGNRTRINAVFADMHTESMLWSKFILDSDSSDPSAAQRWDPYPN
jgi:prepilin-type N-terminal cleavage/methylation domain-containing protein